MRGVGLAVLDGLFGNQHVSVNLLPSFPWKTDGTEVHRLFGKSKIVALSASEDGITADDTPLKAIRALLAAQRPDYYHAQDQASQTAWRGHFRRLPEGSSDSSTRTTAERAAKLSQNVAEATTDWSRFSHPALDPLDHNSRPPALEPVGWKWSPLMASFSLDNSRPCRLMLYKKSITIVRYQDIKPPRTFNGVPQHYGSVQRSPTWYRTAFSRPLGGFRTSWESAASDLPPRETLMRGPGYSRPAKTDIEGDDSASGSDDEDAGEQQRDDNDDDMDGAAAE